MQIKWVEPLVPWLCRPKHSSANKVICTSAAVVKCNLPHLEHKSRLQQWCEALSICHICDQTQRWLGLVVGDMTCVFGCAGVRLLQQGTLCAYVWYWLAHLLLPHCNTISIMSPRKIPYSTSDEWTVAPSRTASPCQSRTNQDTQLVEFDVSQRKMYHLFLNVMGIMFVPPSSRCLESIWLYASHFPTCYMLTIISVT